eukprot:1063299-Pelagomonas_calceolata.AAC.1
MLFALGAGAEKGFAMAMQEVQYFMHERMVTCGSWKAFPHQLQPALYTLSTPCHDTPAASKLVAHTSSTTCIPST